MELTKEQKIKLLKGFIEALDDYILNDLKRPFGNSDIEQDVANLIEVDLPEWEDSVEYDTKINKLYDELIIHYYNIPKYIEELAPEMFKEE